MADEYNEQQYLALLMHDIACRARPAFQALGYDRTLLDPPVRHGSGSTPPFSWQIGHQLKDHHHHSKLGQFDGYIVYEAFAYNPTKTHRGKTETFKLEDAGRSVKLTYDHEAVDLKQRIKDTVETTERTIDTYETHASLSITSSISAEAKAGIDGVAEASVKTETTTSAEAGFGQSAEVDDSKTVQKEFEVTVDISKGERIGVTVDLYKSRDVTEITESGYMDFSGHFAFGAYYHHGHKHHVADISFANRQYLIDLLDGKLQLDYPQWTESLWKGKPDVKDFRDWLADIENFRVDLKRQEIVEYEEVAEVDSYKL